MDPSPRRQFRSMINKKMIIKLLITEEIKNVQLTNVLETEWGTLITTEVSYASLNKFSAFYSSVLQFKRFMNLTKFGKSCTTSTPENEIYEQVWICAAFFF